MFPIHHLLQLCIDLFQNLHVFRTDVKLRNQSRCPPPPHTRPLPSLGTLSEYVVISGTTTLGKKTHAK